VTLTVGITTRDRPASLARAIASLACIAHLNPEIIVFDDASAVPVSASASDWTIDAPLRILRSGTPAGYIVGRNRMVREASRPFVLLMDDDAALIDEAAIEHGIAALERDPQLGAIAFAQAEVDGRPWDERMQPGRGGVAACVPSFIGFAHLLRRDVFLALGGYRERFVFYGEEKEYCLRLLNAGSHTLYLPDARVVHNIEPAGRSGPRYLRYVTRNDCMNAMYNEPLYRLAWLLPARLALYFRMRRAWSIADPWGWAWVLRELAVNAVPVMRDRHPVSRATRREWRRMREAPRTYRPPKC
jgi:GT2 family glycosyltransferase